MNVKILRYICEASALGAQITIAITLQIGYSPLYIVILLLWLALFFSSMEDK